MIPGSVVISIEISRVTRMCDLPDGSNKDHPTTERDPRMLRRVVSFVEFCEHLGTSKITERNGLSSRMRCTVVADPPSVKRGTMIEDRLKTLVFSISKNSTGYPPLDVMTEGYKRVSF